MVSGAASLKAGSSAPGVVVALSAGGERTLTAKAVILATGARARVIPAIGLVPDGDRVWTYREAMVPKAAPASLLVVGSGAIGIEFASFYRSLGAEVTVIEALPRIVPVEDEEISAAAQKAFEKRGLKFRVGAKVTALTKTATGVALSLEADGKTETLEAEKAIVAVGIEGNVEGLGLESLGVTVDRGHVVIDSHCATNVPGLYAIGDIAGPPWLAHKASHEGVACVEHIAGQGGAHLAAPIPGCTYSTPQIASIGLTEGQAKAKGLDIKVGRFPFRVNGKAIAAGETEAFAAKDPLPLFRAQLASGPEGPGLAALEAEIDAFLEECIRIALPTPPIDPRGMEADLFATTVSTFSWIPRLDSDAAAVKAGQSPGAPEQLNTAQALNRALRKILTERPESLVLGQDIGTYGGAFKVTEGLLADFGRPRVLNTPLAESVCTGYAIGLALGGFRPIEEFQFADFSTEAVTQITLNAATMHFRSGAACPLVLRLPCGGGLTFGSFHSQELESLFLSMPGLKALYPSTPQDAFNALLAAYEDDNPVLLFEHKGLYRRGKHPVAWDPDYRDIWQPRRLRIGNFATFVTYGEMTHLAQEVGNYLAEEYEASIDLFDLRALAPLRLDAIEESLARTHRLIVLHEGRLTHGFGAEIVARLTEKHFHLLQAPPLRIGSLDLPVPFAPELEAAFRPNRDKVIDRIVAWAQF